MLLSLLSKCNLCEQKQRLAQEERVVTERLTAASASESQCSVRFERGCVKRLD